MPVEAFVQFVDFIQRRVLLGRPHLQEHEPYPKNPADAQIKKAARDPMLPKQSPRNSRIPCSVSLLLLVEGPRKA